jgi:Heparinase II/III-like protein/Heparinase II/III N-terminus
MLDVETRSNMLDVESRSAMLDVETRSTMLDVETRSRVTAPRAVVCVVEHLGRDIGVADDACRGRFTHTAVTLELGRRPDWLGGGRADDEEWRIEWVKLYEGLDLAHAFAVTGNRGYLTTWEDLVESFCAQVPVGHDSSDVSARRVQNWIYAWRRFADAPTFAGLRDGLAEQLCGRIALDLAHIRAHLTAERNHRTLELYAVLIGALALPQLDPSGTFVDDALTELGRNLLRDVWPDGVHRECSTDYHMIVLRSFLGVVANAERFGLELPDGFRSRVGLACDFALHVQRPDGSTPSLSDGDVGDFGELLALAGDLLARPDLTWAATRGRCGGAPATLDATFATGGYLTQRSGWGTGATAYADERFMVLDCGPIGDGGHGHYDQLSVEMVAAGSSIVVDPGRFTYADDDGRWRQWFKGTAAHNTVSVDGLDQVPYRRGKPKGRLPTARLVERHSSATLDLITAETRNPAYDAVHTRRIAFVGREYWIVHDRLRDHQPHRYEARWHLTPDAAPVEVSDDGFTVTIRTTTAVLAVPSRSWTVAVEDGWVSPSYGVKLAAPVVTLRCTAACADLVTFVIPGTAPVTVQAECERDSGALTARVVRGSSTRAGGPGDADGRPGEVIDELTWSPGEALLQVGNVHTRGVALWSRRRNGCSSDGAVAQPSWVVVR